MRPVTKQAFVGIVEFAFKSHSPTTHSGVSTKDWITLDDISSHLAIWTDRAGLKIVYACSNKEELYEQGQSIVYAPCIIRHFVVIR